MGHRGVGERRTWDSLKKKMFRLQRKKRKEILGEKSQKRNAFYKKKEVKTAGGSGKMSQGSYGQLTEIRTAPF